MAPHSRRSPRSPWRTLSSKRVYDNPWIRVREDRVINPSGNPGIYGTVHFKNVAIGVIPIEANEDTYLVGQFRYPLNAYSWEIPEGGGELSVPPLITAKRELKEETGLVARVYKRILTMHLSNSATDEKAIIYLAFGLVQKEASPEDDERLKVKRLPLQKAYEMAVSGKITDAMAVAGLIRAVGWLKENPLSRAERRRIVVRS